MQRWTLIGIAIVLGPCIVGCNSNKQQGTEPADDTGAAMDAVDVRADGGRDTRAVDSHGPRDTADVTEAVDTSTDADDTSWADTGADAGDFDVTDAGDAGDIDVTEPFDTGDTEVDDGDTSVDGGVDAGPTSRRWTQLLGSPSSDFAFDVAVGSSGDVFIAGETRGALGGQTNSGFNDAFIAKYDASGARDWVRLLGTGRSDRAMGVATDSAGNAYIVGHTRGDLAGRTNVGSYDAFVAKYDTNGNRQWVDTLATPQEEYGRAIASDGSGHLYVAGHTEGDLGGQTNQSGSGPMLGDAYLAKYGENGNREWVRLYGTADDDYAFGVAVGSSGDLYLGGETEGSPSGQTNNGKLDGFVAKYDDGGNRDWGRLFGTPEVDKITGLATDSSGDVYAVGHTEGQLAGRSNTGRFDAFVLSYDATGQRVWMDPIGTPSSDMAGSVSVDTFGRVWVTGSTPGDLAGQTNAGGFDGFLARYDATGNRRQVHLTGTSSDDNFYSVAANGSGEIYTAGATYGDLHGETNSGSADAFLSQWE